MKEGYSEMMYKLQLFKRVETNDGWEEVPTDNVVIFEYDGAILNIAMKYGFIHESRSWKLVCGDKVVRLFMSKDPDDFKGTITIAFFPMQVEKIVEKFIGRVCGGSGATNGE